MDRSKVSKNRSANMYQFLERLWPLHRTINSDDTERALILCGEYLSDERYTIHRYKPGTEVFTWIIPQRYHINEAWLDISNKRVADFEKNPLHLMSYSLPQKIDGILNQVREHIFTKPERPDAVPGEFKYYERDWGFAYHTMI